MRYLRFYLVCFSCCWAVFVWGQDKTARYEVLTVAFYNVENLFDTHNDPNTRDDDRTPEGRDRWTEDLYQKKVANIAFVLAQIGRETTQEAPAIIGLCEVENRAVLEDLVQEPALRPYDYGIILMDSPDERGIDVALLYQKKRFLPIAFKNYELRLYRENGERDFTRDHLLVHGLLEKEPMYFIVNHWPSRSGGQKRSEPGREKAAALTKKLADSILEQHPKAKLINMGDFNDDPVDKSLAEVLQATDNKKLAIRKKRLFNPMMAFYSQGVGTSCYRGTWNVLDQMHISAGLLRKKSDGWQFWKAGIYNKPFLINQEGRYKGYPYRSFAGGRFLGGYSDHFPVYSYLVRNVN